MTEPGQSHDPAEKPVGHRHRRSIVDGLRAGGTGAGSRLGLLRTRPFTRREWLIGGAALALIALLVPGYIAVNSTDENAGLPPGAVSDDPAASAASPPESVTPPADSGTPPPPPSPSPSPTGDGGGNNGGDDNGRPEPRQVGPAGFDAFEKFLTAFCQGEGQRAAVLLDGPDANAKTGDWACVKVVTFSRINLDAACRDSFGGASQARQTTKGDARTWRCFDR